MGKFLTSHAFRRQIPDFYMQGFAITAILIFKSNVRESLHIRAFL